MYRKGPALEPATPFAPEEDRGAATTPKEPASTPVVITLTWPTQAGPGAMIATTRPATAGPGTRPAQAVGTTPPATLAEAGRTASEAATATAFSTSTYTARPRTTKGATKEGPAPLVQKGPTIIEQVDQGVAERPTSTQALEVGPSATASGPPSARPGGTKNKTG